MILWFFVLPVNRPTSLFVFLYSTLYMYILYDNIVVFIYMFLFFQNNVKLELNSGFLI